MSALLTFLGGSAFRLIWDQISSFLTERQNHLHEIERLRLQADLDAAQHARNMESIRLQADLGERQIRVQGEMAVAGKEVDGWAAAVADATKPSGIWLVDLWNGVIRPMAASIAIFLWVTALHAQGFQMGEWDRELVGVVLGFYFASRVLATRR